MKTFKLFGVQFVICRNNTPVRWRIVRLPVKWQRSNFFAIWAGPIWLSVNISRFN